jgi:hypothetical protein
VARFRRRCPFVALLALVCVTLACPRKARAHPVTDDYLTLTFSPTAPTQIDGRWDVPMSDLDGVFKFERAPDGGMLGADIEGRQADIVALLFSHMAVLADGATCRVIARSLDFTDHEEGIYVMLPFTLTCPSTPRVVDIDYSLFFDRPPPAPQHRALVRITDGAKERSIIFSSGFRHEQLTRSARDRTKELSSAVRNGIGHIASGIDHLLFLLALLLPSVLRREGAAWKPVDTLRAAVIDVAKIVTAFTLAHSITLSLSALQVVRLPSRFVEPAIALSVVFAAAQNLLPTDRGWAQARWRVAFVLGLLHGFGFSAALLELGLRRSELIVTLFGFNVGVEIGQLAVVALFLPVAYLARKSPYYRSIGLRGGSAVIAIVASIWFVQRAFPAS